MPEAGLQITTCRGKVGTYALATVDAAQWLHEPAQAVKPKKAKAAKAFTHPFFAECALATTDPFWAEKFGNAARGKLPRGFSYQSGTLFYRKGARAYSVEVPDEPREGAKACMEFLSVHGGFFSPTDVQVGQEQQRQRALEAQHVPLTWGKLNKRMHECLVARYVSDMRKTLSLSAAETKSLREKLTFGIATKAFGKHNIVLENGLIREVGGLLWDAERRVFVVSADARPPPTRAYARKKEAPAPDEGQRDTVPAFAARWLKLLESFDKKQAKYQLRAARGVTPSPETPRTADGADSSDGEGDESAN